MYIQIINQDEIQMYREKTTDSIRTKYHLWMQFECTVK